MFPRDRGDVLPVVLFSESQARCLVVVRRYLEQDRTIILAVVPANQDVATVDILERAKIVSLALFGQG